MENCGHAWGKKQLKNPCFLEETYIKEHYYINLLYTCYKEKKLSSVPCVKEIVPHFKGIPNEILLFTSP